MKISNFYYFVFILFSVILSRSKGFYLVTPKEWRELKANKSSTNLKDSTKSLVNVHSNAERLKLNNEDSQEKFENTLLIDSSNNNKKNNIINNNILPVVNNDESKNSVYSVKKNLTKPIELDLNMKTSTNIENSTILNSKLTKEKRIYHRQISNTLDENKKDQDQDVAEQEIKISQNLSESDSNENNLNSKIIKRNEEEQTFTESNNRENLIKSSLENSNLSSNEKLPIIESKLENKNFSLNNLENNVTNVSNMQISEKNLENDINFLKNEINDTTELHPFKREIEVENDLIQTTNNPQKPQTNTEINLDLDSQTQMPLNNNDYKENIKLNKLENILENSIEKKVLPLTETNEPFFENSIATTQIPETTTQISVATTQISEISSTSTPDEVTVQNKEIGLENINENINEKNLTPTITEKREIGAKSLFLKKLKTQNKPKDENNLILNNNLAVTTAANTEVTTVTSENPVNTVSEYIEKYSTEDNLLTSTTESSEVKQKRNTFVTGDSFADSITTSVNSNIQSNSTEFVFASSTVPTTTLEEELPNNIIQNNETSIPIKELEKPSSFQLKEVISLTPFDKKYNVNRKKKEYTNYHEEVANKIDDLNQFLYNSTSGEVEVLEESSKPAPQLDNETKNKILFKANKIQLNLENHNITNNDDLNKQGSLSEENLNDFDLKTPGKKVLTTPLLKSLGIEKTKTSLMSKQFTTTIKPLLNIKTDQEIQQQDLIHLKQIHQNSNEQEDKVQEQLLQHELEHNSNHLEKKLPLRLHHKHSIIKKIPPKNTLPKTSFTNLKSSNADFFRSLKRDTNTKDLHPLKKNELSSAERAEKLNQAVEKFMQVVHVVGQVDNYLSNRVKTSIKRLAKMCDDNEPLI